MSTYTTSEKKAVRAFLDARAMVPAAAGHGGLSALAAAAVRAAERDMSRFCGGALGDALEDLFEARQDTLAAIEAGTCPLEEALRAEGAAYDKVVALALAVAMEGAA